MVADSQKPMFLRKPAGPQKTVCEIPGNSLKVPPENPLKHFQKSDASTLIWLLQFIANCQNDFSGCQMNSQEVCEI